MMQTWLEPNSFGVKSNQLECNKSATLVLNDEVLLVLCIAQGILHFQWQGGQFGLSWPVGSDHEATTSGA